MKHVRTVVVPAAIACGGPETVPGVAIATDGESDPTVLTFITGTDEQFSFLLTEHMKRSVVQALTGGLILPTGADIVGNGGREVGG